MTTATQPRPDVLRESTIQQPLRFVIREVMFRDEMIWAAVAQNTDFAYYTPDGRHYDLLNIATGDTLQRGLFSKRYCEQLIAIAQGVMIAVMV